MRMGRVRSFVWMGRMRACVWAACVRVDGPRACVRVDGLRAFVRLDGPRACVWAACVRAACVRVGGWAACVRAVGPMEISQDQTADPETSSDLTQLFCPSRWLMRLTPSALGFGKMTMVTFNL